MYNKGSLETSQNGHVFALIFPNETRRMRSDDCLSFSFIQIILVYFPSPDLYNAILGDKVYLDTENIQYTFTTKDLHFGKFIFISGKYIILDLHITLRVTKRMTIIFFI